ncbi:Ku protein [Streptomyces sp. NPDC012769]|uniref:Ku protein n=1 Tax=Streptomyces sp. NPDC012769 TaxID=3364848 RepID=UPI0036BC7B28
MRPRRSTLCACTRSTSPTGSRVEHRRFCKAEDREIPYEEVGRGYALPGGRMVPLTEEDLAHLPLLTRKTVEVLGFVPGQDIDPIAYGRPYYAGPGGPGADRPYALPWRRPLYVVAGAWRCCGPGTACSSSRLSRWEEELRHPGDLALTTPIIDRELELAETLIRELTGIDVSAVHDEYAHALEQLVATKVSGGHPAEPAEVTPVVDLMAALEESVRTAAQTREKR